MTFITPMPPTARISAPIATRKSRTPPKIALMDRARSIASK
jgi:hypothetical protein